MNQWLNPRNEAADSNLVDEGRFAVGAERLGGEARPVLVMDAVAGNHAESLRRRHDHAAGEELGTDPADWEMVNMGTTTRPAVCSHGQCESGQARRRPVAVWWGGVVLVVRGRESRPHGEGRQSFRGRSAGRPGVRW